MEEFQVQGIQFRGNIIVEAKNLRLRHQDLTEKLEGLNPAQASGKT